MSLNVAALQTTITNVQTRLNDLLANPTPNVTQPDGTSIDYGSYLRLLTDQLVTLNKLYNSVSPFVIRTKVSL